MTHLQTMHIYKDTSKTHSLPHQRLWIQKRTNIRSQMGGLFYLLGEFPLIVRCHLISMLFLMMLTSHNFMCYSYLRHSHSFLDSFGKKRRATNSLPCCVIPYSSNGSLNLLHASDTLKILFTIQLPSSLLALGNGHIGWNLDFICSQLMCFKRRVMNLFFICESSRSKLSPEASKWWRKRKWFYNCLIYALMHLFLLQMMD